MVSLALVAKAICLSKSSLPWQTLSSSLKGTGRSKILMFWLSKIPLCTLWMLARSTLREAGSTRVMKRSEKGSSCTKKRPFSGHRNQEWYPCLRNSQLTPKMSSKAYITGTTMPLRRQLMPRAEECTRPWTCRFRVLTQLWQVDHTIIWPHISTKVK